MLYVNHGNTAIYVGGKYIPPGESRDVDLPDPPNEVLAPEPVQPTADDDPP